MKLYFTIKYKLNVVTDHPIPFTLHGRGQILDRKTRQRDNMKMVKTALISVNFYYDVCAQNYTKLYFASYRIHISG